MTGHSRKLANGKNISYNYPVFRLTRGRKYCVASNGKKPKSLSIRFMAAEESRAHKRRFQLASTELFLQRWKKNYVKEEPPRIELSPRPPVEGRIFDYCRSLSRPTVRVSTPSVMIETTLEFLQVDSGSGPRICRSYARPIVRAPISSAPIGMAFELLQVHRGYQISVP